MKLLYGQPKFWQALYYDTINQEDKAKALLGLDDIAAHKNYWLNVAVLCAVAGVAGAPFTYGVSLLLLFVTLRKLQMYKNKKEAPKPPVTQPLGLLAAPAIAGETKMTVDVGLASGATVGRKTMMEKARWQMQQVAIAFRTRRWLAPLLVVGVVGAAAVGGAVHQLKQAQPAVVAPKQLCECPVKQEPPKQGKAKAKKEVK